MKISLSLEADLKSFLYTGGPFVPSIIQSVYENSNDNLVNLSLELDFYYLLKNHPNISSVLVNHYDRFIKVLNLVVFEISAEEIGRSGNQYLRDKISTLSSFDFNSSLKIKNCLINQKDVRSIDFLDQLSNTSKGKLIYLKQCFVIETFPKEVYLYRWIERLSGCSCSNLVKDLKKGQSFVEVLHSGVLKERAKSSPQICNKCDRIFQTCQIRDSVYLNCQRVRILCLNKPPSNNCRYLQNNIFDLYLNSDQINQHQAGSIVDVCGYFSLQSRTRTINQNQKIRMEQTSILVCIGSYPSLQNPHFRFFNENTPNIEYSSCSPNEYIKLYNNYKQIIQGINQIRFNFPEPKTFTLLKLALLCSIFLWHPYYKDYTQKRQTLSLLILTDEQVLVNRIAKLESLNYKQFPKVYDQQSINHFLLGCHNSILIFNNPTKKEQDYVEQAIRGQVSEGKNKIHVNITVWVILNPLVKAKDFSLDIFDVIVDVTFISNVNNRQVHHEIGEIVETLMENYLPKAEFCSTTVRGKRRYRQLADTTANRNKQSKRIQVDTNGLEFLEQYYIASREHKKTNIPSLLALRKVAIGVAVMRKCFANDKNSQNVDFGDAIISIFLDEQTSRNKKGNSNTLLANEIAKFLLNEKEEMVINEFVFKEEDFEEVRKSVHRSSVFIRIVDEIRRIVGNQPV